MANIVFQHLTQDQRIKARQEAGEAVQTTMGDRPKPELFKDTHISKYPDWLIKLMVALCAGLLIVAFIPSAIRLWHIGSETFGEAIDSKQAMVLVGYCVVLLAEIGAILFTLAWAILETTRQSRAILGASIVASASIALVGNYEIGLVRAQTVTMFTWLETLLPPLLTLSTAFILKEVALDKIKHRHADNSAYNTALKDWESAYYHPEQHPDFDQLYANSLKDKFYQINAAGQGRSDRIALMNGFSDANWSAIIRGEMQADSWFDLDSVEDVQESDNPLAIGRAFATNQGVHLSTQAVSSLSTGQPLDRHMGFPVPPNPHEQAESSVSTGQSSTPTLDRIRQEFVNSPQLANLSLRDIQAQLEFRASVETIRKARDSFQRGGE